MQLKKLSDKCSKEVSKRPNWQQLIELGRFNETKALRALAVKETDLQALNPTSVAEAKDMPVTTLASLKLYRGKEVTDLTLAYLLTEINDAVADSKAMAPAVFKFLITQFAKNYSFYKLSEVKLCLEMGLTGQLVDEQGKAIKIYGQLDVPTVLSWFKAYDLQRTEVAATSSLNKHKQIKTAPQVAKGLELMLDIAETLERSGAPIALPALQKEEGLQKEEPSKQWKYRSLQEFCTATGRNYEKFLAKAMETWGPRFAQSKAEGKGIEEKDFYRYQMSALLVRLNDSKTVKSSN